MPSYETCLCVSVCCCVKFGDQRGSLQQIKNMNFGEYSGVGNGIFRRKSEILFLKLICELLRSFPLWLPFFSSTYVSYVA